MHTHTYTHYSMYTPTNKDLITTRVISSHEHLGSWQHLQDLENKGALSCQGWGIKLCSNHRELSCMKSNVPIVRPHTHTHTHTPSSFQTLHYNVQNYDFLSSFLSYTKFSTSLSPFPSPTHFQLFFLPLWPLLALYLITDLQEEVDVVPRREPYVSHQLSPARNEHLFPGCQEGTGRGCSGLNAARTVAVEVGHDPLQHKPEN